MVVTIKGLCNDYAEMFSGDIINATVVDTKDKFGHISGLRKDITFECNNIFVHPWYMEFSILCERASVDYKLEFSNDMYESIEVQRIKETD